MGLGGGWEDAAGYVEDGKRLVLELEGCREGGGAGGGGEGEEREKGEGGCRDGESDGMTKTHREEKRERKMHKRETRYLHR